MSLSFVGPPTPDLFRRQVGRFGERHYIDPLPADDIWPALDADADPWPSVTTVKKAWPFYAAKKWAAETVAEWAYDNVDAWKGFDRPTAVKLLADQAEHSLNRAGKRGTEVHEILDALAAGQEQVLVDPAAELYLDACRLVIADLKPRWITSETVALSRTMGYGGTFDAVGIVEIEGLGICIVDWKSRKPGKNGAYPEEGAQVAAYAACDYMIIAGPDGNAVRAPMPQIDHGLIVSIDPEGYECHLVDLDHATESWKALRAFWQAQRKSPMTLVRVAKIGGGDDLNPPAAVNVTPAVDVGGGETTPPTPQGHTSIPADPRQGRCQNEGCGELLEYCRCVESRRQLLVERVKSLRPEWLEEMAAKWPVGVPTFKQEPHHTDEQLDAIEKVLDGIDWGGDPLPTPEPEPQPDEELPPAAAAPTWQPPDEGISLDEATVEAIKTTIATLDPVTLAQVNDWSIEAHKAQRPFSLSREDCRTQRRFEIMRAAIALSPYEPDVQRAALGFVMDDEVQPAVAVGAALGSLTIVEATRLALLAESLGSSITVVYDNIGFHFAGPGLAAVAA